MSILYLTNKYYKLEKKYNTIIIKDKYQNTEIIKFKENLTMEIMYNKYYTETSNNIWTSQKRYIFNMVF